MTAGEKAIEAARKVYLWEASEASCTGDRAAGDAAVRKYAAVCREHRGR
ncbi:MAG: hypothetical protein PGN33_19985 [Methylobacterium radiotolerans]